MGFPASKIPSHRHGWVMAGLVRAMTVRESIISLFIDADACPVKQEIYRVAERHALKGTALKGTPLRRHGRNKSGHDGEEYSTFVIASASEAIQRLMPAASGLLRPCGPRNDECAY